MANYELDRANDLSIRYESARDEFGPANVEARIRTLGWNHKVGSRGLLQLEHSRPETEAQTAMPTPVGYSNSGFARNTVDVSDELTVVNLKLRF